MFGLSRQVVFFFLLFFSFLCFEVAVTALGGMGEREAAVDNYLLSASFIRLHQGALETSRGGRQFGRGTQRRRDLSRDSDRPLAALMCCNGK